MRIALVTPRYAPDTGGIETLVAQLARRLALQGHGVEIVTQTANPLLPAIERLDGLTVRRFRTVVSGHYAFAPSLWTHLARHNAGYDIVHAHNYHALPALGATLRRRSALVFTPHYHGGGHSPLRHILHRPYRPIGTRLFRHADGIICNSEAEARLVKRHFASAIRHITIVPCGVDAAAIEQAAPFPHEGTAIVSVGRLEGYKSVDIVIRAMAYLDETFVLYIAGDGPARPALQRLCSRLALQHRVHFLGRIDTDEIYRWLRTAAVFATMSCHESYGIASTEALAAGAAVVAAAIPAHRDLARRAGGAMTLVPPECDPVTLAQALCAASSRPRPPRRHHSFPSWDDVAAQTLEIYQLSLYRG